MSNELKITRNYSFWKHPIKYFKERNRIKFANFYFNYLWEHGMKQEVEKMQLDAAMYGTSIMKDGKRVDPLTVINTDDVIEEASRYNIYPGAVIDRSNLHKA